MSWKIQLLVVIVLLMILLYIIKKIRKRELEIRYALSWIAALVSLLIFTIFPQFMGFLASLFGVVTPSNWLFIIGFSFFVLLVLSLTIALSKLSDKNKVLVQEIALLKKRIETLEKNLPEHTKPAEIEEESTGC